MFDLQIGRRGLLKTGLAGAGLAGLPTVALSRALTDRRFVFITQRGGADGLGTIMPVGDPGFAQARGAMAEARGTRLDGMFALHPALRETAGLYAQQQALFVHAVASSHPTHSHFEGQHVLEYGGATHRNSWANRLLTLLPATQGDAAPVSALCAAEPGLAWLNGATRCARAAVGDLSDLGARSVGTAAAHMLTGPNTRILTIDTGGWDTHADQGERLDIQLRRLDTMIGALKAGLGAHWANTLVLVATEFGRTVSINGEGGTDHGTGSAAMLIGGSVSGGRVLADWPGLSGAYLHKGRDLKPTLTLESLVATALAQHYGLDPELVKRTLYPDDTGGGMREALVRT